MRKVRLIDTDTNETVLSFKTDAEAPISIQLKAFSLAWDMFGERLSLGGEIENSYDNLKMGSLCWLHAEGCHDKMQYCIEG